MLEGSTFESAIVIKAREFDSQVSKMSNDYAIIETATQYASMSPFEKHLERLFGSDDGKYFILNRYEVVRQGNWYVCFYIEDESEGKSNVYFRIEK